MNEQTSAETDGHICLEAHSLSRRRFLGGSVATAAATISAPAWLPRVALGAPRGSLGSAQDTLVCIFLRGGMDGLTTCVPYGDADLYNLRPTLAIKPPGSTDGAIDLDGFFGLPPAAQPLMTPFQQGHLAFVHATGSTDPSRSHFDAQKLMELGIPNQNPFGVNTGWITRHLNSVPALGGGLLRAMAIQDLLPRSLAGAPATLPVAHPETFVVPGSATTAADRRKVLTSMYTGEAPPLGAAALSSFATIDLLSVIDFVNYTPANGAVYPTTTFGTALKSAAALIKADIDLECIGVDIGGWDLHNQLGPLTGSMASNLDQLGRTLLAFYLDIRAQIDHVTLVAMSEFGRRAGENASAGLDHGHGNCMLVMGGHVAGGQVMRNWPGLAPANLDNGDLAITIDYRDILSEILEKRMSNTSLGTVFPNYTPQFRGIII